MEFTWAEKDFRRNPFWTLRSWNVIKIHFSYKTTFILAWEKYVKSKKTKSDFYCVALKRLYKQDWNVPCFRPCATPQLRLENHNDWNFLSRFSYPQKYMGDHGSPRLLYVIASYRDKLLRNGIRFQISL